MEAFMLFLVKNCLLILDASAINNKNRRQFYPFQYGVRFRYHHFASAETLK